MYWTEETQAIARTVAQLEQILPALSASHPESVAKQKAALLRERLNDFEGGGIGPSVFSGTCLRAAEAISKAINKGAFQGVSTDIASTLTSVSSQLEQVGTTMKARLGSSAASR